MRLDLELTQACDHRCAHCYNVWNAPASTPGRPLPTPELKEVLRKAIEAMPARHLTVTGGEPLLHRDALEIIAFARPLLSTISLVTNGGHLSPEVARRLGAIGLTSAQLTLLAGDRELHDRLKGVASFDDTLRAILDLQDAGVGTRICYVATRANAGQFQAVLELAHVLGVRHVSYNRMSPAGGSVAEIDRLLPSIDQVETDLDVAERLAPGWNLRVATAMPIPPCVVRISRYEHVRFGFCGTGTSKTNYVLDAMGDVRSCNLSSRVLGNLARREWSEIAANEYPSTFRATLPEVCRECHCRRSCVGGCKESAAAVCGDHGQLDPFVAQALGA